MKLVSEAKYKKSMPNGKSNPTIKLPSQTTPFLGESGVVPVIA
jgi:hypothetical protein